MKPDIIIILIQCSAIVITRFLVLHRVLTTKQIHHVSLLTEIHSDELPTSHFGKVLNQTSFSDTWWSLNKNGLVELISTQ